MAGFKPDETVDGGGFRGIVPEDSTVPVLVIDSGARMVQIKNGDNAGKTATIYGPVVEVLIGKYKGARIYGDVWCNVQPDPAGGDPVVFGSHSAFCKLCDITEVMDPEDGAYPVAADLASAEKTAMRFVGKMFLVTVGTDSYIGTKGKNKGKTIDKNTIKSFDGLVGDQREKLLAPAAAVTERYAKYMAKKSADAGGDGFGEDDDLPF
jgi:hypothetical protein